MDERTVVRIGVLYPGRGAEEDYACFARRLSPNVAIHVVSPEHRDSHTFEAMDYTGAVEHLVEGTRRLLPTRPDVVLWACTCASFVHGLAGARAQVAAIEETAGVPATSTSLAFLHAARVLGVRRVAVAATYPADVAALFASFLAEGGIAVTSTASLGIMSGHEVGNLVSEPILDLLERADAPSAEAILVPDTALHTCGLVARLERHVGKPVLTANLATVWQGLRLVGGVTRALHGDPELDTLLSANPAEIGRSVTSPGTNRRWPDG
jgi:maleate cis-trans isomerase